MTDAARVEFDTTLSSFGNNTGIEVPKALIEQLGAGQRPPVLVHVNGFEFRTTVGVMSGKHLVGVTAATRKATGLAGGDPVHVVLTVAAEPRQLDAFAELFFELLREPGAVVIAGGLTR